MPPTIPFAPEPIEALKARYPAAVKDLVDSVAVFEQRQPPPSREPANVFDTQLGLRLIVSRDRLPDGRIGIHVSASWERDLPAQATVESLMAEIAATWRAISGSTRDLELLAVTPAGIPHFFVEQAH
jgi:hypothetical protein